MTVIFGTTNRDLFRQMVVIVRMRILATMMISQLVRLLLLLVHQ